MTASFQSDDELWDRLTAYRDSLEQFQASHESFRLYVNKRHKAHPKESCDCVDLLFRVLVVRMTSIGEMLDVMGSSIPKVALNLLHHNSIVHELRRGEVH